MSSKDFTQKLITEQIMIGRVITQATTIESMLNAYIAEYYTRCPNGGYQNSYLSFIHDVMNERLVSISAKVNILFKIYKRIHGVVVSKHIRTLFEHWLNIRNKFAHGNYVADKGILYNGDFFEVEELTDKHAQLQIKILAELEKYAELRGPYFNQFPVKEAKK